VPRKWGNINSFNFYPTNTAFITDAPLSTTTAYLFKFRKHNCPSSIKVLSKHAKRIIIKMNKEAIEDEVDSSEIKTFSELVKMQNGFSSSQIQVIAERLPTRELLLSLLKADRDISKYESLLVKLDGSPELREKILKNILELMPQLVKEDIEITERGFKVFMALYEK